MSLFRLDASIRVEGSHSRAIADIVEQEWRSARLGESVVRRHVGVDPIPATDGSDRRPRRPPHGWRSYGAATSAGQDMTV